MGLLLDCPRGLGWIRGRLGRDLGRAGSVRFGPVCAGAHWGPVRLRRRRPTWITHRRQLAPNASEVVQASGARRT